ncbi:unnamed protein product [Vitrella brassicaformis CCMP3155]|uniref:Dihydrolipoamide acetyltransferase component of pyruvate dehydrogenase complex n=1 Tax=Vitrella brassicaformis (strain CCMP3155) TaxID=1169540 RepID=A0A0G4EWA8_VITBC|nr:unnamed protein product [Vitrella brassicaformis CCMP3155]|mmetsp:Transcript_50052/g.125558  ORF Transcript_50052/g.125558 Transcript_50052/m.125558 type:complete len:462 (-) Transcript_50052:243-1628(-)|eukprot:CEM03242.1 unnamed protein product [Vitrella brassicaformis CCMP3155]
MATRISSMCIRGLGALPGRFATSLPNHLATYKFHKWLNTSPARLGLVTFKLADIGEGIAEVELLKNYKKVGEEIEEMEQVCEVQSDKAAVEITSRYSGLIKKIYNNEGDVIKIGAPLMDIEVEGEGDDEAPEPVAEAPKAPPKEAPKAAAPAAGAGKKGGEAAPAVRRLAKELGVDLANVAGSGKGGRITKEDVEAAAKGGAPAASPAGAVGAAATPIITLPTRPPKENVEVPIRGFARAMVKSMEASLKVPHMNVGDEIDVSKLMELRAELRPVVEKTFGLKLTVTPLVIKAFSLALLKYPILNSKIDPSGDKYTQFGSHNISMAIDTPNGLVVPNIKNVQDLNVVEIQSELSRLQKLSQDNKLSNADLTGGTVSISNVGVIGGTYVKAILFDGQALIFALGKTQALPRFDDKGTVVKSQVMNVGYSADHRHVDGATVARFATELKMYLENPGMMLLRMA